MLFREYFDSLSKEFLLQFALRLVWTIHEADDDDGNGDGDQWLAIFLNTLCGESSLNGFVQILSYVLYVSFVSFNHI